MDQTTRPVAWRPTGDERVPLAASVDGETWQIRIADFPEAAATYVLMVDGREVGHMSEWPAAWARPAEGEGGGTARTPAAAGPADSYERGAFEAEIAHFERSRGVRPSSLVRRPGDAGPDRDINGG